MIDLILLPPCVTATTNESAPTIANGLCENVIANVISSMPVVPATATALVPAFLLCR